MTVLVTTHYLDEAEHCHRIAVINAGKMAALGTVDGAAGIFADRPILELRSPAACQLMRALDERPEVEKTTVFGYRRARGADQPRGRSRRSSAV